MGFDPSSIHPQAGDSIVFEFRSGAHSAVRESQVFPPEVLSGLRKLTTRFRRNRVHLRQPVHTLGRWIQLWGYHCAWNAFPCDSISVLLT